MKKHKLCLLVLFMLVLTACAPRETAALVIEETRTVSPTTYISKTSTVTATAIPTETATQTPSRSPTGVRLPSPTIGLTGKMVPEKYQEYIGMEILPLPEGFTSGAGWLVYNGSTNSSIDWGIDLVRNDEEKTLWFSIFSRRDKEGNVYWRVSDILVLPPFESENEYLIDNWCMLNGVMDHEILVYATLDIENYDRFAENSSIRLAWRANRETGAFEVISTAGIECQAD